MQAQVALDPPLHPQVEVEVLGEQADRFNLEDVVEALQSLQQIPEQRDYFKGYKRAQLREEDRALRMGLHEAQEVSKLRPKD